MKTSTLIRAAGLTALLSLPAAAQAACTGSSKLVDSEYGADPATLEWTEGYTYELETIGSNVSVTVTVLDEREGLATPYLFDVTSSFAELPMTLSGNTATGTLSGYQTGDDVAFVVKIPCAGGQLITQRFVYTVGDDCGEAEAAGCTGESTDRDEFYSSANTKAQTFTEGYQYTFTTNGSDVDLRVQFNDNWTGLANPYLFLFENNTLKGDPIAMAMVGNLAKYTLTGQTEGDELCFLVQVAMADGYVAYTKRFTYTVGDDCSESGLDDFTGDCVSDLNGAYTGDLGYESTGTLTDYHYSCTTTDNGVLIKVKYDDYFAAGAASLMDMTGGELQGAVSDKPMTLNGNVASYTLTGYADGTEISFMTQMAYEGGAVVFTKIGTYTVGSTCSDPVEEQLSAPANLKIVPNPASEYVTVNANGTVRVVSMAGRVQILPIVQGRVDISHLAPGTYTLQKSGVSTKLVKK